MFMFFASWDEIYRQKVLLFTQIHPPLLLTKYPYSLTQAVFKGLMILSVVNLQTFLNIKFLLILFIFF